ncbi:MAG: hypothetical protein ACI4V1_02160, partial [Eubacteriales bacterium]
MKRYSWKKLAAAALAACMTGTMALSASAGWFKTEKDESFYRGWDSYLKELLEKIENETTTEEPVEEPAPEPAEDDTASTEEESGFDGVMLLVEDDTTVEEGTELRATTYALSRGNTGTTTYADDNTTLKYFPVTMYNYDATTINNATHQVEVEGDLGNTWNGIYFNDGNPGAESYTYSTGGEVSYTSTTVIYSNNNNYNTYINNGYYVDVDGTKYLVTGLSCTRSGSWWDGYTYSWTITYAGGMATSSKSSITLYKASTGSTATTASLFYADWNHWDKSYSSQQNNYGQYTYSGLVESTLTANKDITFTKPDGGIFNSDATVKDIYTGVEMPFVYENGTYTFDASQNGVYFYADSTQGSTAAQSNGRLYFNEGKPQSNG